MLARKTSGGFDLLAGNGAVVAHAMTERGLPLVEATSAAQVRTAADALGAMSPSLRAQISTAAVDGSGDLSLHLSSSDAVVTYGPSIDAVAKAVALAGILGWANVHHVRLATVDVSAPSAPFARPVGAVQPTLPACHGKQQATANCA